MQALIELLAGFIVMLATAALAQFGVSLDRPSEPQPEVRRVVAGPGRRRARLGLGIGQGQGWPVTGLHETRFLGWAYASHVRGLDPSD